MSHFAVMVIGQDVEKQLAPYHEFECTGRDDQYVKNIDVTDECRKHGLDWYGLDENTVTDESEVELDGVHKYGYAVVDSEGLLVKAVNRTNPNKEWDWYQVGGRWSGFLKLKQDAAGSLGGRGLTGSCANDGDGRADVAVKGAIDFEGMRDEAGAKAAANWDKAAEAKIASGFAAETTWDAWQVVRERHPGNIEAAREEYHSQEVMRAVKKALDLWDGTDKFLTPREEFIKQARESALVLFGVVKDSKWFAKGEMGWFGMSTDDMTQPEWNRKVNELLDELPDDTLITVVDCHI